MSSRNRKQLTLESLEVRQLMAADLGANDLITDRLTADVVDSGAAAVASEAYDAGPNEATGNLSQLALADRNLVANVSNLMPGDYNNDGRVTGADFIVWRNSRGQTGSGISADGNRDGVVDDDDYQMWRSNFGSTAGTRPADDRLEENDTVATATSLGAITAPRQINDLVMVDGIDWYRFSTERAGDAASHVALRFSHQQGDVDMKLFNSSGELVAVSESATNDERIPLEGLPAGEYYLAVYGFKGAQNPNYALEIRPNMTPQDDRFEENDTIERSTDLGEITGPMRIDGLALADSQDWYTFVLGSQGTRDSYVAIEFAHSNGDLELRLVNGQGQVIGLSDSPEDFEGFSLEGLPAGRYFVQVFGYEGATNPNYSLEVVHSRPQAPADDRFEENDTSASAYDLGTIAQPVTIDNLVLRDEDWYSFSTVGTGTANHFVAIDFAHIQGDIEMRVLNSRGEVVRVSNGGVDGEGVSFEGLPADRYRLHVYGYQGATNPSYRIRMNLPDQSRPQVDAYHTLYLNFDGVRLSNADLARYANNQWHPSAQDFDPQRDGLLMTAFQPNNPQREQYISAIMQLLQDDLNDFGISVQRTTGGAVEGVGATTVFVGTFPEVAPYIRGLGGIASSVDRGNRNATDIALVNDRSIQDPNTFIYTMADVILHEAGHTYGLFHVDTLQGQQPQPESMGFVYTINKYGIGLSAYPNTSFLNQTFVELVNQDGEHGLRYGILESQNSYQEMMNVFGRAAGSSQSLATVDLSQSKTFTVRGSDGADDFLVRDLGGGAVEVVVNGASYVVRGDLANVAIFTGGDQADQIRIDGDLGDLVTIETSADAYVASLGKLDDAMAGIWSGFVAQVHEHDHGHHADHSSSDHGGGCCCASCLGGGSTSKNVAPADQVVTVAPSEDHAPDRSGSDRRAFRPELRRAFTRWADANVNLVAADSSQVADAYFGRVEAPSRNVEPLPSNNDFDAALADLDWSDVAGELMAAV